MNIFITSRGQRMNRELRERILGNTKAALDRVSGQIRELRISISDQNGPKGGEDKRCLIWARLSPRGVLAVSKSGVYTMSAVSEGLDTLRKTILARKEKVQLARRRRIRKVFDREQEMFLS